jgi:hypothetical protein
MGARRFGPQAGRFLQQDSYEDALGNMSLATDPLTANRYALAAGNPVSFVEVDGHMVRMDGGGGSVTVRRSSRRSSRSSSGGNTGRGYNVRPAQGQYGFSLFRLNQGPMNAMHAQAEANASAALQKEAAEGNWVDRLGGVIKGYTGEHVLGDPGTKGYRSREAIVGDASWVLPGGQIGKLNKGRKGLDKGEDVADAGGDANKARRGAGAADEAPPGRRFVVTPKGYAVQVPGHWTARTADNGRGIVYQRPGSVGDADSIRIMEPTKRYPEGHLVRYDRHGHPIDAAGGVPKTTEDWHIPLDKQLMDPLNWPQG